MGHNPTFLRILTLSLAIFSLEGSGMELDLLLLNRVRTSQDAHAVIDDTALRAHVLIASIASIVDLLRARQSLPGRAR